MEPPGFNPLRTVATVVQNERCAVSYGELGRYRVHGICKRRLLRVERGALSHCLGAVTLRVAQSVRVEGR